MNEQQGNQKGANIPRKRNALGRGLSALMSAAAVSVDFANREGEGKSDLAPDFKGSNAPSATAAAAPHPAAPQQNSGPNLEVIEGRAASHQPASNALEGGLMYLSIDRVFANKAQPRKHFSQPEIDTLAESIHKTGLLQPIVVRRRTSDGTGQLATYEIVAGERRFRAARQAGLVKIPALLRQITDRESLELGIVENVQRADLNPVEEAAAFQRLADEFGATQAEIAETVGKDRASVANALRLLKLSPEIQEMIVRGTISAGHGRAILMLEAPDMQLTLAKKIAAEHISVRGAEQLATSLKNGGTMPAAQPPKAKTTLRSDPTTGALEERLRRALGTKVKLQLSKDGGGELRISFFSAAELERLLEKIGA